jgi:hypothetical protein
MKILRYWSLCLACSLLASFACSQPNPSGDAHADASATDAVMDTGVRTDVVADRAPTPFDAGPAPSCTVTASVRHIVDRPGGDLLADPAQLLATSDGFLVAARYVQQRVGADSDAGAEDASHGGGTIPVTVLADRSIVLPLDADGTPRAPVTLRDGVMEGTAMSAPRLHRTMNGVLALFQEVRGNASAPNFLLRLHAALLANDGSIMSSRVVRERVALPDSTVITAGVFGTTSRVESVTDGGIVAATPISLLLDAQGMDVRPLDVVLTNIWPNELRESRMRARPDGGAMLVYRNGSRLAFIPFDARGVPEPTGSFDVVGPEIPVLDDATVVGDGVIAGWSRNIAGTTEVHVVVAGFDHGVRLDRELDRFTGEGPTTVSVVPAYGGAALVWRRGVDANARVRIAIVAPDGTVRVPARDLVMAPNIEGRLQVESDGATLTFVVRDGTRPDRWGYTFGRACVPTEAM